MPDNQKTIKVGRSTISGRYRISGSNTPTITFNGCFRFPRRGASIALPPLLGEEERATFATDEMLKANQRRSLDVMLAFFGLSREGLCIEALPTLNMREHIWLKRGGHNHLRISRIIRSLYLCHQPELAKAFQQAVIEIGTQQGVVPEQAVGYWRAANEA